MTFQRAFTGEAKKKMLVMKSVQGDFSGSASVPVGKHELRVELSSEQNHYLGVSRLVSEFAPHEAKTLTITVHGHDRQMLAKLD